MAALAFVLLVFLALLVAYPFLAWIVKRYDRQLERIEEMFWERMGEKLLK